jgi:hypothetical protein
MGAHNILTVTNHNQNAGDTGSAEPFNNVL